MFDKPNTSNNRHLPRPTGALDETSVGVQLIANGSLKAPGPDFFIQNSIAENSRRAYLSDLREFEKAGYSIPATPQGVAQYFAASVATLVGGSPLYRRPRRTRPVLEEIPAVAGRVRKSIGSGVSAAYDGDK